MLNLDHIVISAESLLVGQEFIEDKLGVKADPGGEHPVFGTHNKLISFVSFKLVESKGVN